MKRPVYILTSLLLLAAPLSQARAGAALCGPRVRAASCCGPTCACESRCSCAPRPLPEPQTPSPATPSTVGHLHTLDLASMPQHPTAAAFEPESMAFAPQAARTAPLGAPRLLDRLGTLLI